MVHASAGSPLFARLAHGGHAGANGQLARNEVRPTRRATGFRVVIGEEHALLGKLIEIGRSPGHHSAMVGSDVPHADIVAHDEDDVRLLAGTRTTTRLCHAHHAVAVAGEREQIAFRFRLCQTNRGRARSILMAGTACRNGVRSRVDIGGDGGVERRRGVARRSRNRSIRRPRAWRCTVIWHWSSSSSSMLW